MLRVYTTHLRGMATHYFMSFCGAGHAKSRLSAVVSAPQGAGRRRKPPEAVAGSGWVGFWRRPAERRRRPCRPTDAVRKAIRKGLPPSIPVPCGGSAARSDCPNPENSPPAKRIVFVHRRSRGPVHRKGGLRKAGAKWEGCGSGGKPTSRFREIRRRHRQFFLCRYWATIPKKRENWMCRMGVGLRAERAETVLFPAFLCLKGARPRAVQHRAHLTGELIVRERFRQELHAFVQHAALGNHVGRVTGHEQDFYARLD